jgi:dienelactone hydrolase
VRRFPLLLLALVTTLAGCGGSSPAPASAFGYDSSRPLDVMDRGVVNAPYPIAIHDTSYASGDDRVEAFLAVPPGRGRRPAVLYLHPQGGDRASMLEAALWLAARGVVTMTITAPSIRDEREELPPAEALERLGAEAARDVIAARRGLDLLAARDDVDADRLGVVGWSAGGRAAAVLAGADQRIRAAVLLAPGAAPVSEFVEAAPPELRDDVERTMTPIDPFAAIAATQADVLVQAGRQDSVVPRHAIEALVDAAPAVRIELRWYDTDHALDEQAYREHLAWLVERLDVTGPVVAGARTGP